MTNTINEGFKEAQKEFDERFVKEIKEQTLRTLESLEKEKANKANVEENIRILKLDLEDLKLGRLDKIKERQDKSSHARAISEIQLQPLWLYTNVPTYPTVDTSVFWCNATSGTYTTATRTYYL